MKKKLVLAKETMRRLEAGLGEVVGGATVLQCNTIACTTGCPSSPNICQSGKYPC